MNRLVRFTLVAGLALVGIGCHVKPFCLDCDRGDQGPITLFDGGGDDSGGADGPIGGDSGSCVPTGAEVCDGIDNDCDGEIDNGEVAQVGDVCSSSVGECKPGHYACVDGQLECGDGAVLPQAEECDGLDNDCDGTADNGNPGGGVLCGNGTGDCVQGSTVCVDGKIDCQGGTGPQPEECDGHDNDCNGEIDDGNPGGGEDCGAGPGVCVLGTVTCVGGHLQCLGAGGPVDEICNGKDDNCNGQVDEGFNTAIDVDNCGFCGTKCVLDSATPYCNSGMCHIKRCDPDHWDIDGDESNGCEYPCVKTGIELCNGKDDDCNGKIDDALPTPPPICSKQGECTGTVASCDGTKGWVCHYGATVSTNTDGQIVPETDCDNKDNDCNGKIDDLFPNRTKPCTKGTGACVTNGTQVCNATHDALECNAPTPGDGGPETCNGIDDDCNGMVDDGAPDEWVSFTIGVTTKQIYKYEASHPDATASALGNATNRSCSAPNRLPWVNVNYPAAKKACEDAGARLCTEDEWQAACESKTKSCTWSYAAMCSSPQTDICNDNKHDTDLGKPLIQNKALPTGAMPMCYAVWDGGNIYDMSGNVKEWTQARSPNVNPYRGGSYSNPPGGTTCQAEFALGDDTFTFANIGFRCCKD